MQADVMGSFDVFTFYLLLFESRSFPHAGFWHDQMDGSSIMTGDDGRFQLSGQKGIAVQNQLTPQATEDLTGIAHKDRRININRQGQRRERWQ